jgi:hypothetical protein
LGINEVLKSVPSDVIESSVAKMNEYYLNNADYDERLYTMCHEVSVFFSINYAAKALIEKQLNRSFLSFDSFRLAMALGCRTRTKISTMLTSEIAWITPAVHPIICGPERLTVND